MSRLQQELSQVAAILGDEDLEWALAGGLAVSARTAPRFTRDVDIIVAVDGDDAAEATVRVFRSAGYTVLATVEQVATGRLATARLLPPGETAEGVVVDLLFASSGIEPEVVRAAETLEVLPDLWAPLPRVGHLIAMKVLARDDRDRPQDRADLKALLDEATDDDLETARDALRLIDARGFHRRKALSREWVRLIRLAVAEPPARRPTPAAVDSLTKRFDLPNGQEVAEWETAVAGPSRIDQLLDTYEAGGLTDEEALVLMRVLVRSFEALPNPLDSDPRWTRLLELISNDIDLHRHTVWYWSALDPDSDDRFRVACDMRMLLLSHRARFAGDGDSH